MPHGHDQVCPYTGPDTLAFWRIQESIKICHGDGHVSAWGFEHWLATYHVESVIEIVRDQLPLLFFFVCSPLGVIDVELLVLLSLIVDFSIEEWFVVADIEDQISSGRENRVARETQGVWGEIHVVVFILRA